ncbi:MAG: UV DNA damage repair endonuclease UvsE, partial [Clostridium sp.]
MVVNLGYVAIALNLKDATVNKTITYKSLSKLDPKIWNTVLKDLALKNIENIKRIIRYNKAYGIKVYRLTSKIIPLATHEAVSRWRWEEDLADAFKELGSVIRENNIRVSTHPDHFVLLNSKKEEVVQASIKDLEYHMKMYELMGLSKQAKMVLHIGGGYGNKKESIDRFYKGFNRLSNEIKSRIILENDDKTFNVEDVLEVCNKVGTPMVLDVHHDWCNQSSSPLKEYINDIFNTWDGEGIPPKIHYSSPKNEKEFRYHHDYIKSEDFLDFIFMVDNVYGKDIDIMIEAKQKDLSLLN